MDLGSADEHRKEIANRIRSLREDNDLTIEDMARATGRSAEEYEKRESGEMDLTFTFLYKCAKMFGVDITELMTGESPHIKWYSIVRPEEGMHIDRHSDFEYLHKAPFFKGRLCEPFLVDVPYQEESQNAPIHLSYHKGQELDYVLKGHLRFAFEDHIEEVGPGDTLLYDSGRGHGIIAIGGEDAQILAVVIPEAITNGEGII
ncbi:MAG: helix-turn-helix transcriptional regulator [Olsenella sp.]|nr:helix-turn-helix transcriptional regulator [Olsenella sp.]